MPWENFLSPESRKKSQREVALFFCKYMSCLNCRKGQKKPPCQKPDYFRSSLLREHRLVTDSHRAIASTNAGARFWAHSACTQGHCGGNVYSIGQRKRYIHQQFNTDIMYTSKQQCTARSVNIAHLCCRLVWGSHDPLTIRHPPPDRPVCNSRIFRITLITKYSIRYQCSRKRMQQTQKQ